MLLRAHAKINLSLDVIGRREDGYHDVRMIMQMVGMYDRLTLTPLYGKSGVTMETNLSYLPVNDNNLVIRAAKLLMEERGVTDGLHIRLDKFIPVAAGLAGGSSDAAQTLIGVNRLFRLGFSMQELMERGKRIGADVPYCILGGTALSEGIGEILTPLSPIPDCRILLCKPPVSISTADVYQSIDSMNPAEVRHPDVDAQLRAIEAGDLAALTAPRAMCNTLEEVTGARHPVIGEIEELMQAGGALRAVMSGSGPTVFGIFDREAAAEAVRAELREKYPAARTFLTWPKNNDR